MPPLTATFLLYSNISQDVQKIFRKQQHWTLCSFDYLLQTGGQRLKLKQSTLFASPRAESRGKKLTHKSNLQLVYTDLLCFVSFCSPRELIHSGLFLSHRGNMKAVKSQGAESEQSGYWKLIPQNC